MVVDPAPIDAGMDAGFDAGRDAGMVVDPPPSPPDASAALMLEEAEDDAAFTEDGASSGAFASPTSGRDSAPQNTLRTDDLPLTDPPSPRLVARREEERVLVRIDGVRDAFSTRWESDGAVEGDGPEVAWTPASDVDHIRVAVRTRGGVAVVTLRASAV
ncbi:MAG: hypothetical protein R3B82_24225 [Sandaracinaceae bacterium]